MNISRGGNDGPLGPDGVGFHVSPKGQRCGKFSILIRSKEFIVVRTNSLGWYFRRAVREGSRMYVWICEKFIQWCLFVKLS